jgi:hypothetical protein
VLNFPEAEQEPYRVGTIDPACSSAEFTPFPTKTAVPRARVVPASGDARGIQKGRGGKNP